MVHGSKGLSLIMGLLPGLRVAYNLTYTVEKVSTHTWSDCPSAALYSTFWNFVSLQTICKIPNNKLQREIFSRAGLNTRVMRSPCEK